MEEIEFSQEKGELDFSQIEEKITEVENHFFDEPVNDGNPRDSNDLVKMDNFIQPDDEEVDQTQKEEESVETELPQLPRQKEKLNLREINPRKVERKRQRKLFYYEVHPIPVMDDQVIDKWINLAEEGMLKNEFGYDSQRFEVFLLNIFRQYDFIGEIPFARRSFEYICELIQKCYIKNNFTKITQVPPALFIASMVFCARYSEDEARNFWKPYAKIVWKKEISQYFQNVSRKHFVDCKEFLQNKYDFAFPIINIGDVVHPVYFQAIIPYYLQSNFAEWLVGRFEKLLAFSIDVLPHVLSEEKSSGLCTSEVAEFCPTNRNK